MLKGGNKVDRLVDYTTVTFKVWCHPTQPSGHQRGG